MSGSRYKAIGRFFIHIFLSGRKGRRDSEVVAGLGVGLDFAAMRGHDGFGDRQPDAIPAGRGTA